MSDARNLHQSQFGAYRKGRVAYSDGVPIEKCPYPDYRTDKGSVTFSRSYRKCWIEGWSDAKNNLSDRCISVTYKHGEAIPVKVKP